MAIDGQNLVNSYPVYDTSKSVGTYTANLARQAAQRQAEQKALQDDVDKIKIDGLRDADKDDYFKGFEDWRTTAQQATKERDFKNKAGLQSESDRKFLELQNLVAKSKEYNRTHQDVSMKLLDDKFRDQFTDDAVDKWRKSGSLPLSSKEIVLDPTALGRQMDLSGVNKVLTDLDEDLLKQAKYSNPAIRRINKGKGADARQGTEYIYQRNVDPQRQLSGYTQLYKTNRDIRNYVRQEFPDQFNNMPEDQARDFALSQIVSKRPIQRQDAPKLEWDTIDNWKQKADYNDALMRARKRDGITGGNEDQATFWQTVTNKILDEEQGSGEFLTDAIKSNIDKNGQKFVGKIEYNKNNDNGTRTIKIPAIINTTIKDVDGEQKVTTEVIKPAQSFTYDPKDRVNSARKITDLLNIYTNEKEPYRKQFTEEGKGKVRNGEGLPTSSSSKPLKLNKAEENGVNAVMKANGISREQAINALRKAGKIK